jgi:two-component system, response regulator
MSEGPVELLLVEDNPADQELTLHVLRRHNLANRVKIARDGAEALEFLFGAGPDAAAESIPRMILLDLKLPKVSGIEVLARLKADARTKHIPVVVLTSSQQDTDLKRCYELGVNSYVVKPVDFGQFAEAVRQLGLYWLLLNQDAPVRSTREGGACAGT